MRRAALLLLLVLPVAAAAPAHSATHSGMVIKTAYSAKLRKTIVVDATGRTVYLFTYDNITGKPQCAATDPSCPTLWPAVPARGKPVAGKGIQQQLLSVVKGAHGVSQVSYNHHPLYYWHGGQGYAGDSKPGDANGQKFFNVWFVVSPRGNAIK